MAIKNRREEGAWLFYGGKDATCFLFLLIHERALSISFTEAIVKAALELQDMLIDPIQRMVKRRVERTIFAAILMQAGHDPIKAQVRLNWGNLETPEIITSDLIDAQTKV